MSRALLLLAALLLLTSAGLHMTGYNGAVAQLSTAEISLPLKASVTALWVDNSVTLSVVAMFCLLAAFRPQSVSKVVLNVIALIPLSSAFLLFVHLGVGPPAILMATVSLAMIGASVGRGQAAETHGDKSR